MTRALSNVSKADKRLAEAHRGVQSLARRPATAAGGAGAAKYEFKVGTDASVVVAGDGRFYVPIPEDLDGATLVAVEAHVSTVSSSGSIQIQLQNTRTGLDILSTVLSIDPNEKTSQTAATPAVINTANDDVLWSDQIRVDVDAAGTGARGLTLIFYYLPAVDAAVVVEGAKGDPGGITAFRGQWVTSTSYVIGDAVTNNGSSYVAITNHTSGASTEPGVGASWQTAWMLLAGNQQDTVLTVHLTGENGAALTAGVRRYVEIPFAATLKQVVLLGNTTGSCVVDVYKTTYASFDPPTTPGSGQSITASAKPTISSAKKSIDSVLSGWTTAVSAGDILAFNVDSISFFSALTISLKMRRI